MTTIEAWISSTFGQIPPLTAELATLECLKNELLAIVLSLVLTFEGSGYLLHSSSYSCPRVTSCSCDSYRHKLICGGKTHPISQVPTFPENRYVRTAILSDNNITSLPGNVFSNLTAVSSVHLERNVLSSIDPVAFSGPHIGYINISNNQLQTLRLSGLSLLSALDASSNKLDMLSFSGLTKLKTLVVAHNQLKTIPHTGLETLEEMDVSFNYFQSVPEALMNMTNLRKLRIQYNPIKVFHGSLELFVFVGDTLQYLVFGSPELQSWPTQLHWLRHLQTLYVHGLNMTSLPQDAFKGLWYVQSLHIEDSTVSSIHENALSELMNVANLFIENTGLHGIPAAICDLQSLRHLNVSGNHMSNSRHLVPSCPTPLLEVVSVYFNNNSLTSFPGIFSIFPNITRLYITNNPRLTTITSDKIPKGINTKYIYLNGNGFTTIPSALEKLTQLTHTELNNNHITSISRVLRFQNLSSLSLRNNPINNISPSAFVNTTGLYRLDLANTGLTTIPHALSGLGENWRVDLQENPIRCTCALKWAKDLYKAAMSWVDTSRIYDGNCYGSNWRLLSYMRRNITQCH